MQKIIRMRLIMPFILLLAVVKMRAVGVPSFLPSSSPEGAQASGLMASANTFGPTDREMLLKVRNFLDDMARLQTMVKSTGGNMQAALNALQSFSFTSPGMIDQSSGFTEVDRASLSSIFEATGKQRGDTQRMLGALQTGDTATLNATIQGQTGFNVGGASPAVAVGQ